MKGGVILILSNIEVSLFMALVDFIPVIIFMIGMGYVIKIAYGKIKIFMFAILTGGVFLAFIAGLSKSTWKFLYCRGYDYVPLNTAFIIYQTVGFFLIAVGVVALLIEDFKNKSKKNIKLMTLSINLIILIGSKLK